MTAPCLIVDPESGVEARVTKYGQLVSAPISFSETAKVSLNAVSTPFNVLEPESLKNIVITGIYAGGQKSVSNTDPAQVAIFGAEAIDSAIIAVDLFSIPVSRGGFVPLNDLNLILNAGLWLNATTDDATVDLTILYYRVPVDNL